MNNKTNRRVSGEIAIYYGIGGLIGAISGIIGIGIWLFKIYTDQATFSWGMLAGMSLISIILGVIGYSILRVGYEEIEK